MKKISLRKLLWKVLLILGITFFAIYTGMQIFSVNQYDKVIQTTLDYHKRFDNLPVNIEIDFQMTDISNDFKRQQEICSQLNEKSTSYICCPGNTLDEKKFCAFLEIRKEMPGKYLVMLTDKLYGATGLYTYSVWYNPLLFQWKIQYTS